MPLHRAGLIVVLSSLLGCAGATSRSGGAGPSGDAYVLASEELSRMGSGTLLQALVGRVPTMQVLQRTGYRCPSVIFRGSKTVLGDPNAAVYVDGTPATDTCILQQLRVQDVERVEVYPSGIARSPGYAPHATGLILVFLRGA